jgi:hypothetical protein
VRGLQKFCTKLVPRLRRADTMRAGADVMFRHDLHYDSAADYILDASLGGRQSWC